MDVSPVLRALAGKGSAAIGVAPGVKVFVSVLDEPDLLAIESALLPIHVEILETGEIQPNAQRAKPGFSRSSVSNSVLQSNIGAVRTQIEAKLVAQSVGTFDFGISPFGNEAHAQRPLLDQLQPIRRENTVETGGEAVVIEQETERLCHLQRLAVNIEGDFFDNAGRRTKGEGGNSGIDANSVPVPIDADSGDLRLAVATFEMDCRAGTGGHDNGQIEEQ